MPVCTHLGTPGRALTWSLSVDPCSVLCGPAPGAGG